MPSKYALIIGNSEYSQLSKLVTPVEDVRALANVLMDPQIGGFQAVQTLIDRPFSELQRQIAYFYDGHHTDDLLLLYFSGHGLLDKSECLYLTTIESNPINPSANSIEGEWIAKQMAISGVRSQVLVLDCCFGGAILRNVKAGQPRPVGTEEIFQGFGRTILTASDWTQYSFEGADTEGQLAQSVFTQYLVEGLSTGQADFDGDHLISVDDWYDYAFTHVTQVKPNQHPMKSSFQQRGKVYIAQVFQAGKTNEQRKEHDRQENERGDGIIVDPSGLGQYTTIGEAIQAARPGDTISIRPGIYNEGLVVDKPVHLIGKGKLGRVVISVAGIDVVLWKSNAGSVRNLVLCQDGGNGNAIDVTQGSPLIEGCDITSTSQNYPCIVIHNSANPVVRGNRIHDGKNTGVFVFERGGGLIEDNEIYANEAGGVAIKTEANPTVRGNRIHDGKGNGVFVDERGGGLIEDNEIYANEAVGVAISTEANPTVRGNRIHDGKNAGVFVYERGGGLIEDNEIYANEAVGVAISTEANPTVRGNRIHDGKSAGVFVFERGGGLIEDNEIYANASSGVAIKTEANPTIRSNRVHDGKDVGVLVYEHGGGLIEDNEIYANEAGGVAIKTEANPTVRGNHIRDNKQSGVYIYDGGQGVIENNILSNNRKAFDIEADCKPNVKLVNNIIKKSNGLLSRFSI